MAETRSQALLKEALVRVTIAGEIEKKIDEVFTTNYVKVNTGSPISFQNQNRATPKASATPEALYPSPEVMQGLRSSMYSNYSSVTRLEMLGFPRFNGDKIKEWLFKVEQFFEIEQIPDELKIGLASIHFDDLAITWHQSIAQSVLWKHVMHDWMTYKLLLQGKYSKHVDDSIAQLKQLQETEGIEEYHARFELINTKVDIAEDYLVTVYLAGLRNDTQMNVQMFCPQTIQQCFMLGRLYETAHPTSVIISKESDNYQKGVQHFAVSSKVAGTSLRNVQQEISAERESLMHQQELICEKANLQQPVNIGWSNPRSNIGNGGILPLKINSELDAEEDKEWVKSEAVSSCELLPLKGKDSRPQLALRSESEVAKTDSSSQDGSELCTKKEGEVKGWIQEQAKNHSTDSLLQPSLVPYRCLLLKQQVSISHLEFSHRFLIGSLDVHEDLSAILRSQFELECAASIALQVFHSMPLRTKLLQNLRKKRLSKTWWFKFKELDVMLDDVQQVLLAFLQRSAIKKRYEIGEHDEMFKVPMTVSVGCMLGLKCGITMSDTGHGEKYVYERIIMVKEQLSHNSLVIHEVMRNKKIKSSNWCMTYYFAVWHCWNSKIMVYVAMSGDHWFWIVSVGKSATSSFLLLLYDHRMGVPSILRFCLLKELNQDRHELCSENKGCLDCFQALVLMKGITNISSSEEEWMKEEADSLKVNKVKREIQTCHLKSALIEAKMMVTKTKTLCNEESVYILEDLSAGIDSQIYCGIDRDDFQCGVFRFREFTAFDKIPLGRTVLTKGRHKMFYKSRRSKFKHRVASRGLQSGFESWFWRLVIYKLEGKAKTFAEMYQSVYQLVKLKFAKEERKLEVIQSQTFDPGIGLESQDMGVRDYGGNDMGVLFVLHRQIPNTEPCGQGSSNRGDLI